MRGKWTLVLVIGVLMVAGAWLWWRQAPVAVTVVHPTRGPAVEAIYATGSVEPGVMLPIASRAAGNLVELNVDEGDQVVKGQTLARLDDTDLTNTVQELDARARLARLNLQRMQELVQRKVVATIDLDQARADLDAAEAVLRRAKAQRGFMTLTAPADGLIIRRDGEVGQFIPAGQAVFFLSCCAPLRVTADVDEEDIPRVRVGQKVVLHADALPGQVFDGTVSQITPKGDPVARTFRVRIRLADPAGLRIGMTVDANLILIERSNALLVPSTALQKGALWLVADGQLHRQPVHIGVAGAKLTEILDGVSPDAQVVAMPAEDLRDGAAVRIRPTDTRPQP
ncbi:efflux RND transporter periplasmic adaptor subunit [Thiorhodococcus mannitoliphagus]|uniref:Efflux RND transporter periplasmic adaptor subunit n=1 Tax=Thiorhodococcus mannitoliphagus TaxID=329406 RepID=A0A6P1E152_9GAMM|nr:efflux RND transporter periplasmic adaptor subunit [Thiorhodococcus mannitoliphagus]NEX23041.1 efflux RND transporter periplasmic adaptor subunit [Thiorhodococcus mannitoliphagus]